MKACELCEEQPATVLCAECFKCYCDGCSEFIHGKASKKGHKTESIPEGVVVDGMCPLHRNEPLSMFCVDEVKLCCAMCKTKKLHDGHNVVELSEILQDSEVFSAAEERKRFVDALEKEDELDKKIVETIEGIRKEGNEAKENVKQTFKEVRDKLEEEEGKIMEELERICNESEEALQKNLTTLREVREYSRILSDADTETRGKEGSRLMELNLVRSMEEQRRLMEEHFKTKMEDLKIGWDSEGRKLSFTKSLFNGAVVPSNVTGESTTWDSVTLTWDAVEGASSYQVEVDGNKSLETSGTNTFTKRGLLADTEHTFRVRAVYENSLSVWSEVIKWRTLKESFETSSWKECTDYVAEELKYSVDEKNPRIATKISDETNKYCTIIGNTPLPLNKVTSWNVKILKTDVDNNGSGIFIGVAPFDINRNEDRNYDKCGWYIACYSSGLFSGHPHNYNYKEYGPRKEKNGQYVHTGDVVGVVMDTAKGELSFALNEVNLGVAYEGIPLDKPLVPCVLLGWKKGDSVELVI